MLMEKPLIVHPLFKSDPLLRIRRQILARQYFVLLYITSKLHLFVVILFVVVVVFVRSILRVHYIYL